MNQQPTSAIPPLLIAIAVVEHAGRFLIGQRPAGVPLAGLWEFPGGKVEPGETPQQAAARECLEETGIAIEVGQPYSEVLHDYEHARVRLLFFACRPTGALPELPPGFRLVLPGELQEYQFPEANARILEELSGRSPLAPASSARPSSAKSAR